MSERNLRWEMDAISQAQKSLPVDLKALCEKLQIKVVSIPLDDFLSGYIQSSFDDYVITVNSEFTPKRQRFVIAHLLGQYLHSKAALRSMGFIAIDAKGHNTTLNGRRNMKISPGDTTIANRFAVSLLTPRDQIEELIRRGKTTADEIAEAAQVSVFHAEVILASGRGK